MSVTYIKWPLASNPVVCAAYKQEVGEVLADCEMSDVWGLTASPTPTQQNKDNLTAALPGLIYFSDTPPKEWS